MSGGAAKRGPTTAVPEEVGMSSARLDQLERFQREMVDAERLPCTHLVVTRHGRTVYVFTLTPTMTTSALRKHFASVVLLLSIAADCNPMHLHATRTHAHALDPHLLFTHSARAHVQTHNITFCSRERWVATKPHQYIWELEPSLDCEPSLD